MKQHFYANPTIETGFYGTTIPGICWYCAKQLVRRTKVVTTVTTYEALENDDLLLEGRSPFAAAMLRRHALEIDYVESRPISRS